MNPRTLVSAAVAAIALHACSGGGSSAPIAAPAPAPSLTPAPATASSGSQTAAVFACAPSNGATCPNGAGNQDAVFQTVTLTAAPTSAATQLSATVTAQLQGTNTCANSFAFVRVTTPSGNEVAAQSPTFGDLDAGAAKTYTVTYSSATATAGDYRLTFGAQCGPGTGNATALVNWSYKIGA